MMELAFVILVFISFCYLFEKIRWMLLSNEKKSSEIRKKQELELAKQELELAKQEHWKKFLRKLEQQKKERLEIKLIEKIKKEELLAQYRTQYPSRFSQIDKKMKADKAKSECEEPKLS